MGKIIVHILPSIGIGFVLQIILHEVGHLIGGLFTGWRFLYLQVYRLVVKKKNRGLILNIVGERGYKCIMSPKSINQGAKLYTMGGCVINLLSSAASLIVLIFVPMSPVMWLYVWSFTAFGVGLLLMNGIASTKRVCNDKACYDLLKVDKHNILCHNAQLVTARYLINGLTYSEIGEEIICLCPEIAKNDIQAYQAVLEYYYYLDIKNYLKMGQALNKIRSKDNISKEVLEIVELELFYVRILCAIIIRVKEIDCNLKGTISDDTYIDASEETIIEIDRELYKVNKGSIDIHTQRIKAVYSAYKLIMEGDRDKAIETLDEDIKLLNDSSFVYLGEIKFCIRQLEEVRNIIEAIYRVSA